MMKKIVALGFCLMLCIGGLSVEARTLKLMTYNLHVCKGLDGILDIARIANVIKAQNADFIAVQEVDSVAKRTGGVDQAVELGKLTNRYVQYAKTIPFDGGGYGIALLSKTKPISVKKVPMLSREEHRALLIAEFKDCYVCCTHFSLVEEERLQAVEILKKEMQHLKKTLILMGDLNAEPGSKAIEELKKSCNILSSQDYTFPANEPNVTIDYIMVSKNGKGGKVKVRSTAVVAEPVASDHRPVVATVKL